MGPDGQTRLVLLVLLLTCCGAVHPSPVSGVVHWKTLLGACVLH